MTKQYSYQGNPVSVAIKIHDQDVTDNTIDDVGQSVDFPNLTEFRVGECSFTLRDTHGDYSPNNPSNFWTRNGGHRTGYNAPIEIAAGFIVDGTRHTETIFKGNIIRLVQDAKAATVKAICTDNLGDMRQKTVTAFGIPRHFMLTDSIAHTGENGDYPIMAAVMPASDDSVSLKTKVTDTPIPPVQKLATEGTLNPQNYVIDREGVKTEGGLITGAQTGYPQIRMKSPYRARHINDVITDILNHAGITKSEVSIPERDVAPHFSSNGRINYDLIGNITLGSSNPVTWNGYVTDFFYNASENKWYFLYNGGRGNPNGISQIITYDVATRTYTLLHKFPAGTEVWKFMQFGLRILTLTSAGGNYDANEASCTTEIHEMLNFFGTIVEGKRVPQTATLKPQLAHYYHGVGSVFMKPDSRRQLGYHNSTLYYAYVNAAANTFGIASAINSFSQSAVITINMDNYENHGGIAFDIDSNGVLHGATTFVSSTGKSQILTFKKAL